MAINFGDLAEPGAVEALILNDEQGRATTWPHVHLAELGSHSWQQGKTTLASRRLPISCRRFGPSARRA